MDMCRVCLSTENEMIPLNENVIANYNLLTSLNIALLDGMPQHTCPTCVNTIGYFAEFREKCIASETTLRELIESKCDIKNTSISTEIPQQLDTNTDNLIKKELEIKLEKCDYIFDDIAFGSDHFEASNSPECGKKNKKQKKKYKKRKKSIVDVISKKTDSKWFCGLCPKSFDSNTKLSNHLHSHLKDKFCGLCKCPLVNEPQLLAHRIVHVAPKQNKCHLCLKRYRSMYYLEYHLRNVHLQSEGSEMSCNLCSAVFSRPKTYANHQHAHTSPRFVCDYCHKTFVWKNVLKSHIIRHTNNKPYICDLCGFSSKFSSGLYNHKLRKHNPDKRACKVCGQVFASQEACTNHKCTKGHPGICPVCGKQSLDLNRHIQIHSEDKKYACDRCPVKYKSKSALIVHKNRHDGNRTIQCPDCPAKFYSANVLIKHRRTHTGEKPYVCEICKKGFTGGHNLKVHMKVHGLNLVVKKNTGNGDLPVLL